MICGHNDFNSIEMTRIQLIVILTFVLSFCISCKPDPPVASFTSDKTIVTTGESIQFSDLSLNEPTLWTWTFIGGNPSTSSNQNPIVTYNNVGNYSVRLSVANDGGSDAFSNYMTAYFAKRPFKLASKVSMRTSQLAKDYYKDLDDFKDLVNS